MCIRRETREKARLSLAFSPVSKPHTHITYMLRQCTSIVYLSPYFCVVLVAQSLVFYVMCCIFLSSCPSFFSHCIVCPYSIDGL